MHPGPSAERATRNAALAGGAAALLGGGVFIGLLIATDFHGLRGLANAAGWFPLAGLLGAMIGGFGMVGMAVGPILAACESDHERD